jgi:4-amino-4-deoxy-L-arabinose transferase-like glycosyltransferase
VYWFVSIIVGIAAGLVWLAIWSYSLHRFGIAAFSRQTEDHAGRRERIKQMGKLWYILIFGVLGSGPAFAVAITAADLLEQPSHGSMFAIAQLATLSVFFGCFHGSRVWSEAFRDSVPFPPNYPPLQ